MGMASGPRTVEEIFKDYSGRRTGIIRALTRDVDEFYGLCDPDKDNLCLYGLPNEAWEVALPVEEVPPELPEPALGINFARDGTNRRDWLSLVAVHSDSWLVSVSFYLGARLNCNERKRLFSLINDLPSVFEVVTDMGVTDSIRRPRVQAVNFELKPGLIIEDIASTNHQISQGDRHVVKKSAGVHQVESHKSMELKLETITKQLETLMKAQLQSAQQPSPTCEQCGQAGHDGTECTSGVFFTQTQEEDANFVGNPSRNRHDPYSNTYNPGWRDHSALSWGGTQKGSGQNPNTYGQPPGQNSQPLYRQEERKPSLQETMMQYMAKNDERMKSLETQIASLATLMSQRPPGQHPSQNEANPREEATAVTLRSGKQLVEPKRKEKALTDESFEPKKETEKE